MNKYIFDPNQESKKIIAFLKQTYQKQKKDFAVIAVSGGVDSAVSLQLITRALGPNNVHALLLPFGNQAIQDSTLAISAAKIPNDNYHLINIESIVKSVEQSLVSTVDIYRLGNIKARVRMILMFDHAKQFNALVCGTENRSEKYLAYYTRYGDEASDVEPIQHLYKTQVYSLANYFKLPPEIINKPPSAELWEGQTDEKELGFSYEQIDKVLVEFVDTDLKKKYQQGTVLINEVVLQIVNKTQVSKKIVAAIIKRVENQAFKHLVPYKI